MQFDREDQLIAFSSEDENAFWDWLDAFFSHRALDAAYENELPQEPIVIVYPQLPEPF
jgi:hypothetical protein